MRLLAPPDMPASRSDPQAVARRAPTAHRSHLLVWVGNHAQAEALVRHAAALARAGGATWTAVCMAAPSVGHATTRRAADRATDRATTRPIDRDPAERPTLALRALALADSLGARTHTLDAGNALAGVVDFARREGATTLLVGGHAPSGWLEGLPKPWLSGLAEALSTRLPGVTIDVVYLPEAEPAERPAAGAAAKSRFAVPAGWASAVAVVAVCLLVSETLLPYLEHASVAVIYLAGVVFVALRHGQSASMLAVVLSILLFDLLVVEPRWSLKPTDPQYYFTFIVMTLVGALVSRLADQERLHALLAEARARRAQALNELAGRLLSAQTAEEVAAGLDAAVRATFGTPSALLLPQEDGALHDPTAFCSPTELEMARRTLAEGGSAKAVPGRTGSLLCLPLSSMAGPPGVLVVRWPAGQPATPEERRLLDALANQAALAMQRVWVEQRSAAAAVEAEAERLRNTLLSGISHDLRTPLTTILGSATSLLEQQAALDERSRAELLRNIVDEAGRMHDAMTDVLDLTRIEQGALIARCEWCPADDLVQEARVTLGPRWQARDIRCAVSPEAVVWCDPRLLLRALVNLLDNALRHTPATTTIEVRVEAASEAPQAMGHWRLVVADNGPGLPPALRDDPFKKFAHGRGEGAAAGTGLGLAICAAVARLHGGRIEAAGRGGAGACFTLTLPQPCAPPSAQEDAA
jgi:two-component system sensor histidine kinase KdpD